ncbi:hypothetical protein [Dyadobacter sp. CY323]|uniref:hypothetical protein n=1 Tax=Dyadobacter sp. CY323 TaxID=2907302 RepID=UPI001F418F0A|nr:hypothetical protein [Dyadobacter sp. CY323]MCE6991175.1 hypothetical protein [Dyadobacter sp. CY323]
MSATPGKDYKKYRWFWFCLQMTMGLAVLFATYKVYEAMEEEDEVVRNSPLVCMKINARERGAGLHKLPDIIYAEYQNRDYRFECGRKYFRSTFGVDSIQVHYDVEKDIAALPVLNFPHYTFMLIMMSGMGILILGDAIRTFRKYRN